MLTAVRVGRCTGVRLVVRGLGLDDLADLFYFVQMSAIILGRNEKFIYEKVCSIRHSCSNLNKSFEPL